MAEQPTSSNIKAVLMDENRKIGESRNLITRLWRTILFDLGIGGKGFYNMVSRYLGDPYIGIRDNSKDRNNHRGNLMKELGSNEISWRVFMRALLVIEAEEMELEIRLKRKDRITGQYVYTKHVVKAKNNISRDESDIDLSNAQVIPGFSDETDKK